MSMASINLAPISLARVSSLQSGNAATQTIDQTQQQLTQLETELSTGKAVNQPSDNPSAAAVIQQLQQTLSNQGAYTSNVSAAQSQLGEVDSTLGDLTNLLTQAQSIASANVSSTVTAQQRTSAAAVVDSLYNQALLIANTQFEGSYLFGGDQQDTAPYVQGTGGVQYVGSNTPLQIDIDQNTQVSFQVTGQNVFGGTSGQVTGATNLAPALSTSSRLVELGGANSNGISLGSIVIGNGTTAATVDLSHADSLNDVINAINGAGLAGVTASIGQYGLVLTATGGANISVNDVGGGTTASDLGIVQPTGAGVNATITGANLNGKITDFTPLAALKGGAGIDYTGFTITVGQNSKTMAVNGGMTIQSLLNEINGSGLGVTGEINSSGTGINVLNAVQGQSMTISENGGTSASDLGIRSETPTTPVADLNNGNGIDTAGGGQNDFSITTADGSVVNVALNSPATIQDVMNQINAAAGGKVTASFATTGNGILLTDNTAGAGKLVVTELNASTAASDLGLTTPAVGNQIIGTDTNQIAAPGIFTDLQNLRDSLTSNNTAGITSAAQGLQTDSTQVTAVRGQTGAVEQELTDQTSRLSDENTATQSLLSQVQDVNYTTAITQFQTLQMSMQAAMESSAENLNLSLFDYLT